MNDTDDAGVGQSITPRPCPACEVQGDVSRQDETLTRCLNEDCDVRLYLTRPGWSDAE